MIPEKRPNQDNDYPQEDYIFKMAFSQIFGNQQRQQYPVQEQSTISQHIIEFLVSKYNQDNYFFITQNVSEKIKELANLFYAKDRFIFYEKFKFGSIIVIQKISDDSFPDIYVVFPTQWKLGIQCSPAKKIMYPDSSFVYEHLYLGKIQDECTSIKILMDNIVSNLQILQSDARQNKVEYNKKNHHTPSWLAQALNFILKSINNNQLDRNRLVMRDPKFKIQSKGGTLDVGQHTGITLPDTVYSCSWALIDFLLQNNNLSSALAFCYKCYLLKKQYEKVQKSKKQKNNSKKIEITEVFDCLLELKANIQALLSYKNIYCDNKKAVKFMSQFHQQLLKDKRSSTTTKITKISYEKMGEISQQQKIEFHPSLYLSEFKKSNQVKSSLSVSQRLVMNKKTIFSDYLNLIAKCSDKDITSQIFEDSIYTLFINQVMQKQPFKDINVADITNYRIQSLCLRCLRQYTSDMILRANYLNYSHIQLMKVLISIICFEVFKRSVRQTSYDVSNYRIPNNVVQIYSNFHSLSLKARKAVQSLVEYHNINCHKTQFFDIEKGLSNYQIYAKQVFSKDKQLQNRVEQRIKYLKQRINQIRNSIRQFHQKKKKIQENCYLLQQKLKLNCQCYQQERKVDKKKQIPLNFQIADKITVRCKDHKELQSLDQQLQKHIKKKVRQKAAEMPETDPGIYEFFRNIDKLSGALEIIIFSQLKTDNQIQQKKKKKNLGHFALFKSNCLCFQTISDKIRQVSLDLKSEDDAQNMIRYLKNNIKILWNNQELTPIDFTMMKKNSSRMQFKAFLQDPQSPADPIRQHQIYVSAIYKPNNINMESYVGQGSIRIGELTQIPLLLYLLISRKVKASAVNSKGSDVEQIILKTMSSLKAECKQFPQLSRQIYDQMQIFLEHYIDHWSSQDFESLPILGPIFSLCHEIIIHKNKQVFFPIFQSEEKNENAPQCHKIFYEILYKIKLRYNTIEEDNKIPDISENKFAQNCAYQTFLCFGGICCFVGPIISRFDPICQAFLPLIFLSNHKIIFANKQNRYLKNLQTYQKNFRCAVQNNIEEIFIYFVFRLQRLNEVMKRIFQGFNMNTQWAYSPQLGRYVFSGKSLNKSYLINIKTGQVITNGSPILRIPKSIKNTTKYEKIFGKRQLQVSISKNFSYLAQINFKQILSNRLEQKTKIFFELGYESNIQNEENIRIFMYRKDQKNMAFGQQIFVDVKFLSSHLNIPKLYRQDYQPWISKQRNCLIFRKPKLENIEEIGAVILYQDSRITSARIISKNQSKILSIDQICDPFSQCFDSLIIRQQSEKKSIPYKILQGIQDKSYIIEIDTSNKIRKFWLHRYELTFIQKEGIGLIAQIFKDYRIFQSPQNTDYLPWEYKKIPALILQKFNVSQISIGQHKKKVIIPKHIIYSQQAKTTQTRLEIYTFDLHDNFRRLFGQNRQSQMFLAAVSLMCHDGTKIVGINMTGLEYSIYLLHSCYSNRPLNKVQFKILNRILQFASKINNQTVPLICHAIFLMTKQLITEKKKLDKENMSYNYKDLLNDSSYQEFINKSMSIYNRKIKEGKISYREKLPTNIAQILGIKFADYNCYNESANKIWEEDNPLSVILKDISQFRQTINTNFQKFNQEKEQILNFCYHKKNNNVKKQCPINLTQISDSVLTSEIMQQLKRSYEAYLQEQAQTKNLEIQKNAEHFIEIKTLFISNMAKIENIIHQLIKINENHIDIVNNYKPTLSYFDFVPILLQPSLIYNFFPQIDQTSKNNFIQILNFWIRMKVAANSCQRIILQYHTEGKIDIVAVLREIQSPRKQIEKRIHWICFEAELKIQIWLSQFQTFQHIFQNGILQKGSVPQLNMGEGKTQVIIPMIVLDQYYKSGQKIESSKIPRINLLTSIFGESKSNYIRFFSITGFNIPIIEIPFDRGIQLKEQKVIKSFRRMLKYFGNKMIIMVDQSSFHSYILKLKQTSFKLQGKFEMNKQKNIFSNIKCLDIFDEVDALMTPKKSFVYSLGKQKVLSSLNMRTRVVEIVLQIICKSVPELYHKKLIITDETFQTINKSLKKNQYPKGLRLSFVQKQNKKKGNEIKRLILENLIKDSNDYKELQFFLDLGLQEMQIIRQFIIDNQKKGPKFRIDDQQKVICLLRGLFAYGIIEHCFGLRYTVDYGIPDQQRLKLTRKRLAVPYQASNIPSKRNDYAQPDVAILLTFLTYYNMGISQQLLKQGILKLLQLTKGNEQMRNFIYKQWYQSLSLQDQDYLKIQNPGQIKLDSFSHISRLHQVFKQNRYFINFLLINCIFPEDMVEFQQSITSSAWDHSDTSYSLGFSGTKDIHRLFPTYLNFEESHNIRIKGTDGKMLDMILENTLAIQVIQNGNVPLWQRFLNKSLKMAQKYNIACVIDVGALLAGSSLKDQIVPWLNAHNKFNIQQNFKGISFCHQNKWMTFQCRNYEFSKRGVIPDNETFIIFDQYRTRGADMKMDSNITGVISIGPNLTKDNLVQAVGRLRKIGRNQKIIFTMTSQIINQIKKICNYPEKMNLQEKIKAILNWTCLNSIQENEKLFYQNCLLAKTHFLNRQIYFSKKPKTQEVITSVDKMYQPVVKQLSVYEISRHIFEEIQNKSVQKPQIKQVLEMAKKYGSNTMIKSHKFNQVQERQIQTQTQIQHHNESQKFPLTAYIQIYPSQSMPFRIFGLNLNFSQNLSMSSSFKYCTTYNDPRLYQQMFYEQYNELAICYFVHLKTNKIEMITIRQANILLSNKIQLYPICSKNEKLEVQSNKEYVARLNTLNLDSKYIKKNKLGQALVHCKFYNGCRFFNEQQSQILMQLLYRESATEKQFCYFLQKRKMQHYFKNSTLQKLYHSYLSSSSIQSIFMRRQSSYQG